MFTSVQTYCDALITQFGEISTERKIVLESISNYVAQRLDENKSANLMYICTHNSRRSQFGQVWAKVASNYFKINNINSYSGGTETTAFNVNAINALLRIGFKIEPSTSANNGVHHVSYSANTGPVDCYSKVYNDPKNPQKGFVAIMTCGEAEENCPFIPGVDLRVATTYDDPKAFDNTELQDAKYDERCRQIALETLYVFSKI